MSTSSIADALRQLLPQAEQDQQHIRSLQATIAGKDERIAELEAVQGGLEAELEAVQDELEATQKRAEEDVGAAQETVAVLRSLLRRVREQAAKDAQELREHVKQSEQRAQLAEQVAEQAGRRAEKEREERLWAEAERARLEQDTDAIVGRVDEEAQIRIREAEEGREAAQEESEEMARKLGRERGKRRKIEIERDRLRAQVEIDGNVIRELREQLDSGSAE
jgi:hypothetical protein